MFDGVPDQFHQFIASRTSLPLPLSFPLHGSSQPFPPFDPYPSHQTVLQPPHDHHLLHHHHQLHHHQSTTNKGEEKQENSLLSTNLELERERSIAELIDPWSNHEVLALLRIRSSMENWFPDFTWEHVSRKLAELGFKRSAEKCKEKFEEESRHFNSMGYNKNFRFFSELEDLCHGENLQVLAVQKNQNTEKPNHEEEEDKMGQSLEAEDSRTEMVENPPKEDDHDHEKVVGKSKKRKRKEKFEMLKGFCEDIANKMMAQQEELHNKLIEDMVKRDEEKIAREEAWKKQEMDRIDKEIQMRAHDQAIAGERQATIIEFLKKFTSSNSTSSPQNQCFGSRNEDLLKIPNTSPSLIPPQNPNYNQNKLEAETSSILHVVPHQNPSTLSTTSTSLHENLVPQNPSNATPKVPTSSILAQASQNPNSMNTQNNPLAPTSSSTSKSPQNPDFTPNERDDIGKRWPRDEVLALINMRCNLYSSGSEDKEGAKGTPLWERISQGMLELGYKRSAKRCKEKWENINKYFRKTKDVNKKRSMDSRTCPYFHQLSNLYSQGILVAPFDGPENRSTPQKNHSATPENLPGSSQGGSSDANMDVAAEGGKDVI